MSPHVVVAFASQIREYRRRHSTACVVDVTEEYEDLLKEDPHVKFSGESQEAVIDPDYCSSVEELMGVGPEKLKEVSLLAPSYRF
ncbi:hypothetical protein B296_00027510 [Ensete ventricosum]|uniref:Uncharacterized protein n=1 Tax=Ensete ventricosum TaxID=4639 RepID=A0A426ZGU5_ENSVE|nr:hypothetical protein B296_00027510 [Ensete ventricosum]